MTEELTLKNIRPMELPPLPDNPLVSVLIANYNYAQYINEAIESVLNQTYQNFEIVICDDGSTDNSLDVIQNYAQRDSRIKYIAKENGGVASALNATYNESKGEIICFLDADDIFAPTKLKSIIVTLQRPFCPGFVLHKMRIIYGEGRPGAVIPILTSPERGYLGKKIYKRGGRWRYMPASAICLRREVADILFPINENLFRSEADGYIFTLVPVLTTVEFVDEVLSLYRLHGRNITGGVDLSPESITKTIQNLERITMGVNSRLQDLNMPSIDIDKNLMKLEQETLLSFIDPESSFMEQLRYLTKMTKMMLKDDLYIPLQKVGCLFLLWTALIIPRFMRKAWYKGYTQPTRLKSRIKSLLHDSRM